MLKQRIMCALGAAIILIVLSLAPSVAQAHTLHRHHVVVHADIGHGSATADPSERHSSFVSQQGQADLPSSSDRNCVGDCCASVCAACCSAGLPDFVQFVPVPRSSARIAFVPSNLRPDRAPESLRRPPKHFI